MLLPLCLEASSHARAMMVTMCALPDREARIDALWSEAAESAAEEPNTKDPSHLYIAMDEESGEPVAARFTYVDEHSCIGCTYCATTARSTFFLEEDHGRARVFDQAGDSEELIQEAIDSCPVNCIHYVSYEDLVILETERAGQFINNAARLRSQQEGTAFVPESKATNFMTGSMRCTNCPGRGCKECPMFGVGENPVYLERVAEREERRQRSGEAQAAEEAQRRQSIILEVLSAAPEAEAEEQEEATAASSDVGGEDTLSAAKGDAEQAVDLGSIASSEDGKQQSVTSPSDDATEEAAANVEAEEMGESEGSLDAKLDQLFAAPTFDDDDDEEGGDALLPPI